MYVTEFKLNFISKEKKIKIEIDFYFWTILITQLIMQKQTRFFFKLIE